MSATNPEQQSAAGAPEAELVAVLRASAQALQPPVGDLAAKGLARGRRMRHTRRAGLVGLTAAAVAGLVVGAVAVTGDTGSERTAAVGAPPSPTAQQDPPTQRELTSRDLERVVSELLPQGVSVNWDKPTHDDNGASAQGVLTDAEGSGQIYVILEDRGSEVSDATCPDMTSTAATCVNSVLADGSTLRLEKNWEYPATASTTDGKAGAEGSGAQIHSAHVFSADGTSLYLSSSDTSAEKAHDATRPAPVLSLAQVKAIVSDPAWQSLPAPGAPDGAWGARPDGASQGTTRN